MYKIGDIVKFKDAETMRGLYDELKVRCGWNDGMNYLCGQTRIITKDIFDELARAEKEPWEDELWVEIDPKNGNTWYITKDMIELVS
jgi:hypothetical protein